MKKFFAIFVISVATLFAISSNSFSFEYEYNAPSLGPIDGYQHAVVKVKDGKVVSITDLKSAKVYTNSKKFPVVPMLITILSNPKQSYSNYKVTLNSRGEVIRVDAPSQGFYVTISNVGEKKESLTKPTDIFSSRYSYNLKKWKNWGIKSYKYNYNFSSDTKHPEGIEVKVINDKITKAIDEQRRRLNINSSILKIDDIFAILKSLIDDGKVKEVTYDSLYGFPSYILYNNKYNKPTTIILSKFIKLSR